MAMIDAVGNSLKIEEAAVNISSANVSSTRPFASVISTPELLDELDEGLNVLQKHREILLQQAETLFEATVRNAGCLSELSIVECIHDSADYQTALKELGDLFKASSDFIYAIEQQNSHVELCIDHYEDEITSESVIEALTTETMHMSDDELENFGYLGWLAH